MSGFKSSVEAYSKLNEGVKLISLGKESGKLVAILEKGKIDLEKVKAPVQIKKKTRKEKRGPNAPALSQITAEELYERLNSDDSPAILVDVRTPQEFHGRTGHVPGATLMPLGELINNIQELDQYKDEEIAVICHSGSRSMMASQLLVRAGFSDVRNLTGGMIAWHRKGYPTEPALAEYE
jgi:rhodanese-related sulfurtransferase